MTDTPLPHTPHMRRKTLPQELHDTLGAAEVAATNGVLEYVAQRARELDLSPAQEAAIAMGIPRVVGAAFDGIALQLLGKTNDE